MAISVSVRRLCYGQTGHGTSELDSQEISGSVLINVWGKSGGSPVLKIAIIRYFGSWFHLIFPKIWSAFMKSSTDYHLTFFIQNHHSQQSRPCAASKVGPSLHCLSLSCSYPKTSQTRPAPLTIVTLQKYFPGNSNGLLYQCFGSHCQSLGGSSGRSAGDAANGGADWSARPTPSRPQLAACCWVFLNVLFSQHKPK